MQVHGVDNQKIIWIDRAALQQIAGRSPQQANATMFAVPVQLENGARMAAGYCGQCRSWVLVSRASALQPIADACPQHRGAAGCSHRVKIVQSEPVERRLTRKQRFEVLRRDSFRCRLCGQTSDDGAKLEVDHMTPLARGGTDFDENLWTLCRDCNRGKGTDEL